VNSILLPWRAGLSRLHAINAPRPCSAPTSVARLTTTHVPTVTSWACAFATPSRGVVAAACSSPPANSSGQRVCATRATIPSAQGVEVALATRRRPGTPACATAATTKKPPQWLCNPLKPPLHALRSDQTHTIDIWIKTHAVIPETLAWTRPKQFPTDSELQLCLVLTPLSSLTSKLRSLLYIACYIRMFSALQVLRPSSQKLVQKKVYIPNPN